MKEFGDALRRGAPLSEFQPLSFRLMAACRSSLDRSWGIRAWTTPDEAAE